MVKDTKYYQILEIEPVADQEQIRKAYRRLSLKWHPDKNRENIQVAEERFKEISEAYEVLRNPDSRKKYDAYGEAVFRNGNSTETSGPSHANSSQFHFRSAEEIFSEFFGGRDPFMDMFQNMESMMNQNMNSGFGFGGFGGGFANPHSTFSRASSARNQNDFQRPNLNSSRTQMDFFQADPFFTNPFFGHPMMNTQQNMFFGGPGIPNLNNNMLPHSGKSVRRSVQIINGQKFETVEEVDEEGNITTTQAGPDGSVKVQKKMKQSSHASIQNMASNLPQPSQQNVNYAKSLPKIPRNLHTSEANYSHTSSSNKHSQNSQMPGHQNKIPENIEITEKDRENTNNHYHKGSSAQNITSSENYIDLDSFKPKSEKPKEIYRNTSATVNLETQDKHNRMKENQTINAGSSNHTNNDFSPSKNFINNNTQQTSSYLNTNSYSRNVHKKSENNFINSNTSTRYNMGQGPIIQNNMVPESGYTPVQPLMTSNNYLSSNNPNKNIIYNAPSENMKKFSRPKVSIDRFNSENLHTPRNPAPKNFIDLDDIGSGNNINTTNANFANMQKRSTSLNSNTKNQPSISNIRGPYYIPSKNNK
ncbi:hypothetical protein BB559_007459 [Furculomyces boomerangus]|uniref:J domain-containing protein n=2 Tax=Harpellales TaxID=61421 RepID=A0A2T9XX68_9FUNG|nr:hypothetical protein BB559_007459 [Furculomyces boomerangus]PVZ98374.1 hypothetical protein BB558_005638 [Smittium angustum]PWA01483.1 hypothetical protein BB558_002410 [Smittium angustum]